MLNRSVTCTAIIALVVAAGPVVAQITAASGPRLVVEEKVIDLKKVDQGEVVDANFKIGNEGDDVLLLKAVRPTCGCTVAEYDREIKPGAFGWVKAKLDTKDFTGPISKSILVMTSDPVSSAVTLVIKADVTPYVSVYPRPLLTFNALQNEGAVEKVVVAPSEDYKGFSVTKVESDVDFFKTAIRPLSGDDLIEGKPAQQFEVTITLSDQVPLGPVHEELRVYTNHPKAEVMPVKVFGVVRAALQVSPPQIQFGAVEAKSGPGRYVMVATNRKGETLEISDAKVDDGAFETEVKVIEEGKRYQVTVSIKPDAEPGSRDVNLVLTTSDKDFPELKVPVRASIR